MNVAPPARMPQFPFTAVVGLDDARLALLLAAVDPAIGGVLLRGQKGSAKTTLARGLAAVSGSDRPFVDLPLGATEDRLVGSIDLAAALTGAEVRFQPGLLAAAHGGVLYVDEVNLLADHLVDVLLDVAVSGVNRVEREGIAHAHPARFVLVGSMNPEEGELRPQLLDRFGLAADVAAPTDPSERVEAVQRRLAFDADPVAFAARWRESEEAQARALAAARPARVSTDLLRTISALCVSVGVEGLRADLMLSRAAAALSGLEGREEATVEDVRRVAPLALAHRRRRQPFDDHGMDPDELDEHLDRATGAPPGDPPGEPESAADGSDRADDEGDADGGDGDAGGGPPGERTASPDQTTPVTALTAPRSTGSPAGGRRSVVEGPRGRLVGDRPPSAPSMPGGVAVGATLRAAAGRRAGGDHGAVALAVAPADVREAIRETKAANLVVLAVDASGSMGAARRMEAAKGAVLSLLLDAYQRRDRVALVTFRGDSAEVVLRPTGSVEVARARLGDLPTGGRTPLAAGIRAALDVALAAVSTDLAAYRPLLVLVTDGRATAGPDGEDPSAAAQAAATEVARRRVPAVVIDAEDGPIRLGLAAELADAMGARHLTLPELSAGHLDAAVRHAIGN